MCEEETTWFDPANGLYIVKDIYELYDKGSLELANHAEVAVDDASFTLIKSLDVRGDIIKLSNVLLEGEFSVDLEANAALRGFSGPEDWVDRILYEGARFETTDLLNLAFELPIVKLKGDFEHRESKRRYNVILNAFVTPEFPGSFFNRPLEKANHGFIAKKAFIRPLAKP